MESPLTTNQRKDVAPKPLDFDIYHLKSVREKVDPKPLKTEDMFEFGDNPPPPKPNVKEPPKYKTRFQKLLEERKVPGGEPPKLHKY